MPGENWTFWLNVMNFAFGAITVLALLVVLGAVGWDLLARRARRAQDNEAHSLNAGLQAMLHAGSHTLSVPELGLTMADGGERIEPSDTAEPEPPDEKPRRK